jgi:8-oxo-dGTP pyrophosphatase MutT (NUDIX family)
MASAPLITCGIYLFNLAEWKVLICHATNASWKTWSVPKGLKDKGESSYAAAVRELKEETGIDVKQLNVLLKKELPPVNYKKQNKILESFLIVTDTPLQDHKFHCGSLTAKNQPEIDRWAWIEPGQMHLKLHESQLENYDEIIGLLNVD